MEHAVVLLRMSEQKSAGSTRRMFEAARWMQGLLHGSSISKQEELKGWCLVCNAGSFLILNDKEAVGWCRKAPNIHTKLVQKKTKENWFGSSQGRQMYGFDFSKWSHFSEGNCLSARQHDVLLRPCALWKYDIRCLINLMFC